ncbi:MAG TPA: hypothetical protein VI756_33265 [Blastocatellia bacterium]
MKKRWRIWAAVLLVLIGSGIDRAFRGPVFAGGGQCPTGEIYEDNESDSGAEQTGVSSISWTHNVGADITNGVLIVRVVSSIAGSGGAPGASVTVNGAGMTLGRVKASDVNPSSVRAYLFYLIGPSPGGNVIVVSCDTTQGGQVKGSAESLGGVSQGTPDGSAIGYQLGGTFTTTGSGDWAVDVAAAVTPASLTANCGQTVFWSQSGFLVDAGGSVMGPILPVGPITTGWSAAGPPSAYAVVALAPAPAE